MCKYVRNKIIYLVLMCFQVNLKKEHLLIRYNDQCTVSYWTTITMNYCNVSLKYGDVSTFPS